MRKIGVVSLAGLAAAVALVASGCGAGRAGQPAAKAAAGRACPARALPGWHVVEGVVKRRRGVGNTQKEVDILIAVDMPC